MLRQHDLLAGDHDLLFYIQALSHYLAGQIHNGTQCTSSTETVPLFSGDPFNTVMGLRTNTTTYGIVFYTPSFALGRGFWS